ncbi:DUF6355 family natural product biosynthesis protein [Allokutzneria albata]|uniref:Secreted protein n=1 Tax=Allokutzneria albata TaxID=211114 RepID=A0A1G9W8W1_ALLAB|nr:DUF6355 family natural product biosynthesis protein [Allokutzneria albata]SDM80940.1 hypothetical protein SAMN04489726_3466 [Allokutzneria albata]
MRPKVFRTFAVVCAAVAGVAVAAPVAQAEAPIGERCGAYIVLQTSGGHMLKYKNCSDYAVRIEIDMRYEPNRFECMRPWENRLVEWYQIADNAWYTDTLC